MTKKKGYWIKFVALSFIAVAVFSVSFAGKGVFRGEAEEAISSPVLNPSYGQEKSLGIELGSALPKIGIENPKEEEYRVSQLDGERGERPRQRYQPRPTPPTPPSPSIAPSAPAASSGLLTTQTPLFTPPPPSPSPPAPPASSTSAPAAAPSPPPSLPPAPPPPGSKPQEPPKGTGFIFNFDNADLYEVIRVMAEVMKLSYLIDPKVKGVVNIHTTGQISSEDIFPVFQTILHLNGATAVKKGPLYEIVPFGDAKKLYTIPSRMEDAAKTLAEEKYVILIVPLKYIQVTEASKMIKPFLSDGADIIEHPSQNILLIGDIASNIQKVVDLLALFDIDLFTDLKVRIYPVFNSDVTDIAKEMERIFASFEVSTKSGRGVGITFTPVTRINALLAVSSIPNIFEKVERWLKQLDQTPTDEAKLGVFVYYVQNGKAKDLADVVKQVFTPPKDKKPATSTTTPSSTTPTPAPTPRGARPTPTPPAPGAPSPPPGEEGGVPTGEINIVVDETTNSMIIRSYPRDYKFILETIKKLDLYPKQVLIEVFLASISLDDSNKFGLEWSTTQGSFNKGGTKYDWLLGMGGTAPNPAMTTGIRYAIAATDKLAAAVNAQAVENNLKIVSSPHLLASNNKEAKIQIGKSQPILTSTYSTGSTGISTGTIEGTIEYKDVGIIMTVTPRISDSALVTMDISLEVSTVESTKLGTLDNVPVFNKKTAKTTLSIMEAQTVVIGGLIEESGGTKKSGVPWFSKIPLLGALFGYQEYTDSRTELMMLLTPHVIADMDQSKAVTREFKDKLDSIRKQLDKKIK
jgi:general secretion pathway protein D